MAHIFIDVSFGHHLWSVYHASHTLSGVSGIAISRVDKSPASSKFTFQTNVVDKSFHSQINAVYYKSHRNEYRDKKDKEQRIMRKGLLQWGSQRRSLRGVFTFKIPT